jgi:hypothetical protein
VNITPDSEECEKVQATQQLPRAKKSSRGCLERPS